MALMCFIKRSLISKLIPTILQGFLVFALILTTTSPLSSEAQSQAAYNVDAQVNLPQLNLPMLNIPKPHLSFDSDVSSDQAWEYIYRQRAMIGVWAGYGQINSAARGFRGYRANSFGPKPYTAGTLRHQPSSAIRYRYSDLNARAGSGANLSTPGRGSGGH